MLSLSLCLYFFSLFFLTFFLFFFFWGFSLTHPVLALFFCGELVLHIPRFLYISGESLLYPMLAFLFFFFFFFNSGEFLLHIPCWLHFYLGSFSYIPHASFIFQRGVSLKARQYSPKYFVVVVLLHIPCSLLYVGSFSYTSSAGFFAWGVSLTHPVLASLCGEFLLHVLC